jgi:hypothetical protein
MLIDPTVDISYMTMHRDVAFKVTEKVVGSERFFNN